MGQALAVNAWAGRPRGYAGGAVTGRGAAAASDGACSRPTKNHTGPAATVMALGWAEPVNQLTSLVGEQDYDIAAVI